jgi:hypothetical protein
MMTAMSTETLRSLRRQLRKLLGIKTERGQAMVEYSSITFFLLLGTAGVGWPFMVALLNALSTYFASISGVLRAPVG